jgi:hypothetical protein
VSEIRMEGPIKFDDRILCHKCGADAVGKDEVWYIRHDDQVISSGRIVLPLLCGSCYGVRAGLGAPG